MYTAEETAAPASRRETEGGFTLVELIVVVVIIGILAAIAIPAYNGQVRAAHKAAALAWVTNTTKAIYMYDLTYGVVPATLADAGGPAIPSDLAVQYYSTPTQFCLSAFWLPAPWVNGFGPLPDTYKVAWNPQWGAPSLVPTNPTSFCVNTGG